MTDRDPFFQRRSEWAKVKHRILDGYLQVWVYKLAYRNPVLAFVDTCAGEGVYGEGQLGSPLLAASWNDRFLRAQGKRLVVIACEERPASAAKLRVNLRSYTTRRPPEAVVIQAGFAEALPEILQATQRLPTLIFIDPYGMKDLTASKLRPLLGSRDRASTEVIARVPPVLLARFTGWLREKARDERGQRTAAAFERLLADLQIAPELLDEVRGGGNTVGVNELLLSYLSLFEQRFNFVQAIPIRESYYAAPRYYLIHGTDSEHGLAHMNDIVSKAEDDLFEATHRAQESIQPSLFGPPQRTLRATIQDAEALIVDALGGQREVPFIGLRAALVRRFGPDLREKHHKLAVQNLEGRGVIERVRDNSKIERRSYRLRHAK